MLDPRDRPPRTLPAGAARYRVFDRGAVRLLGAAVMYVLVMSLTATRMIGDTWDYVDSIRAALQPMVRSYLQVILGIRV